MKDNQKRERYSGLGVGYVREKLARATVHDFSATIQRAMNVRASELQFYARRGLRNRAFGSSTTRAVSGVGILLVEKEARHTVPD